MGISFSLDYEVLLCGGELDYLVTSRSSDSLNTLFRKPFAEVTSHVTTYARHRYPPVFDNISMCLFFQQNKEEEAIANETLQDQSIMLFLLWKIFEVQSNCYIQEILVMLILLSEDSSWRQKLGLLFDLFKGIGGNELMYDDLLLVCRLVAMSLSRLWGGRRWDQHELSSLTEALADGAYGKLKKEIDEPLTREEFVQWGQARFKEGKIVASMDALEDVYRSRFD